MIDLKKITPDGMRDIYGKEAMLFRDTENKIAEFLLAKGFEEIIIPAFEFTNVFEGVSSDSMYTSTDNKGRQIAFRRDPTLSVKRFINSKAQKLNDNTPIKVFYSTSKLVKGRADFSAHEIFQVGVEFAFKKGENEEETNNIYLKHAATCSDLIEELLEKFKIENYNILNEFDNGYYNTGKGFKIFIPGCSDAVIYYGVYHINEKLFGLGFAVDLSALVKYRITPKNESHRSILRLALTKGRIEKQIVKLLKSSSFDVSELLDKGRKLSFSVKKDGEVAFEVVLAKPTDVMTYVHHGICDVGIVGKDTLEEEKDSIDNCCEIMDLKFGKCKFSVAAPSGTKFSKIQKIATKYPNVARKFFYAKDMDINIVKIEGSVELAPLLGLTDAIVDIVETGETLKANGLEILCDIMDISARLITNRAALKIKSSEIELLKNNLGGGV